MFGMAHSPSYEKVRGVSLKLIVVMHADSFIFFL